MAVPEDDYILMVEDDPDQAETVCSWLARGFPRHKIYLVETEFEFCRQLEEFAARPPAVAVIDVILRWSDPMDPIPPRPPEVAAGGIQKAGLRCELRLRNSSATAHVPVVFYTVTNGVYLDADLKAVGEGRAAQGLPAVAFLGKEPSLNALLDLLDRVVTKRAC